MSENIIAPNNAEIDKALKEFEEKSNQEQPMRGIITPQVVSSSTGEVNGVSFEGATFGVTKLYKGTVLPGMVKFVIKYSGGAVKNQTQAERVLFGFVVFLIILSLYILFSTYGLSPSVKLTPEQLNRVRHMQPI